MKHFLITRFIYPDDYPYMGERIELFNRCTLPSVQSQTCKNFTWIILGHPEIDLADIPHVFLDCKSHYKKDVVSALLKYIKTIEREDDELIITSRVDNDDIILPNFIKNVQSLANKKSDPFIIEFRGFWWDQRVGEMLKSTRYINGITSPFLSLVERGKNIKSVYFDNHGTMSKHFPVMKNENFGWIQTIHKHNLLMNKIKPGEFEGSKINNNQFKFLFGLGIK